MAKMKDDKIYPTKTEGRLTLTPTMDVQFSARHPHLDPQMDRYIPTRKSSLYHTTLLQENSRENEFDVSLAKLFRKQILGISGMGIFRYNELTSHIPEDTISPFRKISKVPYKVLDAPALQDDFYLNLIDWSKRNSLAVALSSSVYLWSAETSKVTRLCDFADSFYQDTVSSLAWAPSSPLIAIGTQKGSLQIWDTVKQQKLRDCLGHTNRIGTMAWCPSILSSGSRDKSIINWDPRAGMDKVSKLTTHKQEVCGLKWSPDQQQMASGGNDNNLFIWNLHSQQPVAKFNTHKAAVKAIAWSPHQHGLLASGGGTADRRICFWNTLQSQLLNELDTGSQVCNLQFSKNVNELVSTHGYSQNQIVIWKYPEMKKITTLLGHTYRVLFLAMSPDGKSIVTGAGDETLRFWNVFPPAPEERQAKYESILLPEYNSLR